MMHTPAASFWTNTPKRGADGETFVLDFGMSGVFGAEMETPRYVRLVSGRD